MSAFGLTLHWALLIHGGFGLLLSVYMTMIFFRVQRGEPVKCGDGSCPIVMQTPYARSFGFPNFYVAAPYYAGVSAFAALRVMGLAAWLLIPMTIAAGLALAMSAWLAFALLVKLKQP